MRLNPSTVSPVVSVAGDSIRPIRLRVAGSLCLGMSGAEAIELARQLVAAVDELRSAT